MRKIIYFILFFILISNYSLCKNEYNDLWNRLDITPFRLPILVPEEYPTIQKAVDAALSGDIISVAPGVYAEHIYINYKDLSITSRSGPENTIIDGNQDPNIVKTLHSNILLKGFTIQNGRGAIAALYLSIGAITISNSIICNNSGGTSADNMVISVADYNQNPIIFEDVKIFGNSCGVIFGCFGKSNVFFYNCEIFKNEGALFGYGSMNNEWNFYMYDTVIRDNTGDMYGIVFRNGEIVNCSILNNSGVGISGPRFWFNGSYEVRDSVIKGNLMGGVIDADLIDGCLIMGNSTDWHSAGGVENAKIIKNSIILNNASYNSDYTESGGIFNSRYIENCLIVGNVTDAQFGAGGIGFDSRFSGKANIKHCTIMGNIGLYSGGWNGGVNAYRTSYGDTILLENCIIAKNIDTGVGEYGDGVMITSHCDVWGQKYNYSGVQPGIGDISEDPLFSLQFPFDCHLTQGSPCIDKGIDVGVYIDIEGDLRPFGSGFDMGADEWTGAGSRR